jgi:hypothetical protein
MYPRRNRQGNTGGRIASLTVAAATLSLAVFGRAAEVVAAVAVAVAAVLRRRRKPRRRSI